MALKEGTYSGCACEGRNDRLIDVPFANDGCDDTLEVNRNIVSQPSSAVDANSVECRVISTLEQSTAANRNVSNDFISHSDDEYGHMKCIFESLPETLPAEQRDKAINLLKIRSAIFSKDECDLGRTPLSSDFKKAPHGTYANY